MNLSDCFIEVLAYVTYQLESISNEQPEYEDVRRQILHFLKKGEQKIENDTINLHDYENAKFAVCAWIDESILQSSWEYRQTWKEELLQWTFFNTTQAGIEFFDRLASLDPGKNNVREIYYLALILGFTGRYYHEGGHKYLDGLKSANCKILTGSASGIFSITSDIIFPDAYQSESENLNPFKNLKRHINYPVLISSILPPGLFIFMFYIYHFILNNEIIKI